MSKLLKYIATHLMFLFEDYSAKIVDSDYGPMFGQVQIDTKDLRMYLLCEKGQISLDLQSTCEPPDKGWFSYHIIRESITGKYTHNAMLDKEAAGFLETHMPTIINAFSADNIEETKSTLLVLEKADQKRRWG